MAGFREFVTGEVLTADNVMDFLQKQAVMKFADAAARDAALGTAVREGMVAWLDDTDSVIAYDGTAWNPVGAGGFDASQTITATDASWPVPSLGNSVVKVTVIGGGGGGGGDDSSFAGTGGTTTFDAGAAGSTSATGGLGGQGADANTGDGRNGNAGASGGNGGGAAPRTSSDRGRGGDGVPGDLVVAYLDLDGISTVNVTIGAGGTKGLLTGGDGGRGEVIVEYKAA